MAKVIIHDSSDKEKKIFEKAYEKGVDWHDKEFKELYHEWYQLRQDRTGKDLPDSAEAFQVAIKMHRKKGFTKGELMDKVIRDNSFHGEIGKTIINKVKVK